MIVSFGNKGTENLYHGRQSKETRKYPRNILVSAIRKLDLLNGAGDLKDLRSPPGNQLEGLKGDLKGFFSIRVNDRWRIIFRWESGQAHQVKLTDYHLLGGNVLPKNRIPTHPGEILSEEFLKPMGITQVALAKHLGVSPQRINELVRGKRGITPETAWLLAQAFDTTPEFWINLQSVYDLVVNHPKTEISRLKKVS